MLLKPLLTTGTTTATTTTKALTIRAARMVPSGFGSLATCSRERLTLCAPFADGDGDDEEEAKAPTKKKAAAAPAAKKPAAAKPKEKAAAKVRSA